MICTSCVALDSVKPLSLPLPLCGAWSWSLKDPQAQVDRTAIHGLLKKAKPRTGNAGTEWMLFRSVFSKKTPSCLVEGWHFTQPRFHDPAPLVCFIQACALTRNHPEGIKVTWWSLLWILLWIRRHAGSSRPVDILRIDYGFWYLGNGVIWEDERSVRFCSPFHQWISLVPLDLIRYCWAV